MISNNSLTNQSSSAILDSVGSSNLLALSLNTHMTQGSSTSFNQSFSSVLGQFSQKNTPTKQPSSSPFSSPFQSKQLAQQASWPKAATTVPRNSTPPHPPEREKAATRPSGPEIKQEEKQKVKQEEKQGVSSSLPNKKEGLQQSAQSTEANEGRSNKLTEKLAKQRALSPEAMAQFLEAFQSRDFSDFSETELKQLLTADGAPNSDALAGMLLSLAGQGEGLGANANFSEAQVAALPEALKNSLLEAQSKQLDTEAIDSQTLADAHTLGLTKDGISQANLTSEELNGLSDDGTAIKTTSEAKIEAKTDAEIAKDTESLTASLKDSNFSLNASGGAALGMGIGMGGLSNGLAFEIHQQLKDPENFEALEKMAKSLNQQFSIKENLLNPETAINAAAISPNSENQPKGSPAELLTPVAGSNLEELGLNAENASNNRTTGLAGNWDSQEAADGDQSMQLLAQEAAKKLNPDNGLNPNDLLQKAAGQGDENLLAMQKTQNKNAEPAADLLKLDGIAEQLSALNGSVDAAQESANPENTANQGQNPGNPDNFSEKSKILQQPDQSFVTANPDDIPLATSQGIAPNATSNTNSSTAQASPVNPQAPNASVNAVNAISGNLGANSASMTPASVSKAGGSASIFQSTATSPGDQVVEGTVYSAQNGNKSLSIRLNPDNLGDVRVNLVSGSNKQLTARFIASSAETQQLLQSQADSLKSNLEAQGVRVDKVSVLLAGNATETQTGGQSSSGNPESGNFQQEQNGYQQNANQNNNGQASQQNSFNQLFSQGNNQSPARQLAVEVPPAQPTPDTPETTNEEPYRQDNALGQVSVFA
ncbi:MAG: flagellar hook-length control protein FliK [Cyanobacteria bacterium P01_H01_bin.74]